MTRKNGKPDEEDIEDIMRCQHSTLDHLTKAALHKLARQSWEALQELRQTDPNLPPQSKQETA